jgi:hypothetical protein
VAQEELAGRGEGVEPLGVVVGLLVEGLAACQVAGVPGTPTETPLVTRSGVKMYGCPVAGLMNASCSMAAGAVSRPSSVFTFFLFAS